MNKTKKIWIVAITYITCILTVLSLLLVSYAKYVAQLYGYTDFAVSSFSAGIYDSPTSVADLADKDGTNVIAFGTGTGYMEKLKDCYPGMPARTYNFVISNGRYGNVSSVNIVYSLKVRTMGNIPLHFSITTGGVTYESTATARYLGAGVLQNGQADAPWYEYSFVKSANSEEEQTFVLKGDTLRVANFSLNVTWPISEDKYGDYSNDACYMNEVEAVQIVASLASEESDNKKVYANVPTGAKGLLILDPGHADRIYEKSGQSNVYTYGLTEEYSAFYSYEYKNENPEIKHYITPIDFNNGNGIQIFDANGNRVATQPKQNVTYRVQVLVPYTEDEYGVSLFRMHSNNEEDDTVYRGTVTEYREYIYDITDENYGTYSIIDAAKVAEENTKIQGLINAGTNAPVNKIYTVYSFYLEINGELEENETIFSLSNKLNDSENTRISATRLYLQLSVPAGQVMKYKDAHDVSRTLEISVAAVCNDDGESVTIPAAEIYSRWKYTEGGN